MSTFNLRPAVTVCQRLLDFTKKAKIGKTEAVINVIAILFSLVVGSSIGAHLNLNTTMPLQGSIMLGGIAGLGTALTITVIGCISLRCLDDLRKCEKQIAEEKENKKL